MSSNTWVIVGVAIAILIVAVGLWWHARKSKAMADKPKPK